MLADISMWTRVGDLIEGTRNVRRPRRLGSQGRVGTEPALRRPPSALHSCRDSVAVGLGGFRDRTREMPVEGEKRIVEVRSRRRWCSRGVLGHVPRLRRYSIARVRDGPHHRGRRAGRSHCPFPPGTPDGLLDGDASPVRRHSLNRNGPGFARAGRRRYLGSFLKEKTRRSGPSSSHMDPFQEATSGFESKQARLTPCILHSIYDLLHRGVSQSRSSGSHAVRLRMGA